MMSCRDHPGLKTNETWQSVYSAFDIQKFEDSIDACVAAAKHVSEYPEWIIRPSLNSLRYEISLSNVISRWSLGFYFIVL